MSLTNPMKRGSPYGCCQIRIRQSSDITEFNSDQGSVRDFLSKRYLLRLVQGRRTEKPEQSCDQTHKRHATRTKTYHLLIHSLIKYHENYLVSTFSWITIYMKNNRKLTSFCTKNRFYIKSFQPQGVLKANSRFLVN